MPNSRHSALRRLPGAMLLISILTAALGGCPATNPDAADGTSDAEIKSQADALLAHIGDTLPGAEYAVDWTASADGGPPGALFAMVLDTRSIAWVLGDLEDGAVNVTGIALETIRHEPILTEEVRADGIKFTLPAGDSLDIASTESGLRFTLVLEASDPPSVIVAYGDSEGNITIDEDASRVYLTPAADYDASTARARTPRSRTMGAKVGPRAQDQSWCEWLGNGLESAAGHGCNLASLLTGKAPAVVIDRLCVGVSNFLTGFERSGDPLSTRRLLASFKIGVHVLCEMGKAGWRVVSFFRNLTPWQLACNILTFASNASVALDGQTLADRACSRWGLGSNRVGQGGDPTPDQDSDDGDRDPNDDDDQGGFVYYTLSITVASGDGSVDVSPADESFLFLAGDVLTLTAIPARNYAFDGWDGAVSSATRSSTVLLTMDGDKTVEVYFVEAEDSDAAQLRGIVRSTFSGGDEAWRVVGDAEGGTGVPEWSETGGNPGGSLSADDDVRGGVWYWQASTKFYGDLSNAYGKKLRFDLKQTSAMSAQFNDRDVILSGGGTTIWLDRLSNPGAGWTSYAVILDTSETWWRADGSPATETDIRTVLGSLDDLRIRGEYESGVDTGGLDNVALNVD